MAMTKAGLKAKIIEKIEGLAGSPTDSAKEAQFAEALADAIVTYIQNNAVVTGTVTSGAGAGGAVTGTVG